MDDLSRFCCLNPDCPDYGRRDAGQLSVWVRYGRDHAHRLLDCTTCQARFSERKGTPLVGARLPSDKLLAVLAHLADGCGVRPTARLVGVGKNTVNRLALLAGRHARQLHDELVGFSPLDHEGPTR